MCLYIVPLKTNRRHCIAHKTIGQILHSEFILHTKAIYLKNINFKLSHTCKHIINIWNSKSLESMSSSAHHIFSRRDFCAGNLTKLFLNQTRYKLNPLEFCVLKTYQCMKNKSILKYTFKNIYRIIREFFSFLPIISLVMLEFFGGFKAI